MMKLCFTLYKDERVSCNIVYQLNRNYRGTMVWHERLSHLTQLATRLTSINFTIVHFVFVTYSWRRKCLHTWPPALVFKVAVYLSVRPSLLINNGTGNNFIFIFFLTLSSYCNVWIVTSRQAYENAESDPRRYPLICHWNSFSYSQNNGQYSCPDKKV